MVQWKASMHRMIRLYELFKDYRTHFMNYEEGIMIQWEVYMHSELDSQDYQKARMLYDYWKGCQKVQMQ